MSADGFAEAEEVVLSSLRVTARPPRPGEWVEYRIAFPVDPLENSLRTDPAPQPQIGDGRLAPDHVVEVGDEIFIKPSFEPETAWRVLPLRLEIQSVDSLGFEAFLSFDKERYSFRFPIEGGLPGTEFYYDSPQEEEKRGVFRFGGEDYEATATVRKGEYYGFVRLGGEEPPFGLFRFATENVDLILVGMGTGAPPSFPLELENVISPPPGLLYMPDRPGVGKGGFAVDEAGADGSF